VGLNTRIGKVAAATVAGVAIVWTTGAPTTSATPTIANGAAVTSAEVGQSLFNHQTQITALIADVLALRNQLNDGE